MMKCLEPQIGKFLFLYELQNLDNCELRAFEKHLAACGACSKAIREGGQVTALLRHDKDIRFTVRSLGSSKKEIGVSKLHGWHSWLQFLRPCSPAIGAAFIGGVVIVLTCTANRTIPIANQLSGSIVENDRQFGAKGVVHLGINTVGVPMYSLNTLRSPGDNSIPISTGTIALLFHTELAFEASAKRVCIINESGSQLSVIDSFPFDNQGRGLLELNTASLVPGKYSLIISVPQIQDIANEEIQFTATAK